jgi:hypothetical protein
MILQSDGVTIKAGLPATGTYEVFEFEPEYPPGFQNHFFDSYMDPTQVHDQLGDLADEFPNLVEVVDLPNPTDGYQRPGMAIMKNGTSNPGSAPSGGTAQSQAVVLWSHAMGHEGGNEIQAAFVDPGAADSPLSVSVSPNGLGGSDIVVSLGTDAGGALASTAAAVAAAINADPASSALVRAATWATNAGAGIAQARDLVALSDFLSAPEHVERGPFENKVYRVGSTRDGSKVGVFLYCQQHAREWVTPLTCLETAERLVRNYSFDPLTTQLVDNLDIFILPTSNPDGGHYSLYDFNSQRKNLRNVCELLNPTATNAMPSSRNSWGVDPNRNNTVGTLFDGYDGASTSCTSEVYAGPSEASEAEIQNEIWVAETFDNIRFANNIHTYGGYFMWAPGSYIANGRITLPAPNIGIEAYFFEAGDLVLQRIKEYRGVAVLPQRTGPIADVLYSAAGNSADEQYYAHDIIAYSFEAGADRFTSGTSGTSQSAVGFQPDFESEGQHEAMEFANGNYGMLESAMAYAFDDEAPTVDFLVCDSLSPTIECDPVTTNQAKQSGSYITTFAFDSEPSVIRYTTDGSEPTMSSPTWEAQGPRRPGQFFEYDETTTIKYFGTDIKGNVGAVQTIKLSIDDVDPTIEIVEPVDAGGVGGEGNPGNYALGSEHVADFSCDDDDSGVISCVGTVADGAAFDTSTVGFHDFTVNAEDLAGNTASLTHTYNVYFPGNGGLLPPLLNASGQVPAGAGSAVPLKFSLGGVDYGLGIIADGFPRSAQVDCASEAVIGPWVPGVASGDSGFRYTSTFYHYNWKTDPAWRGTCRVLQFQLIDNSVYELVFKF